MVAVTQSATPGFRPSIGEVENAGSTVVDANKTVQTADNLIGGAITVGLGLMIVVLMALVVGQFVAEVPSEGAFSDAINSTTDTGNTAFTIFGVALLAVPVVALVAYFYQSGLGGFISGGMGR